MTVHRRKFISGMAGVGLGLSAGAAGLAGCNGTSSNSDGSSNSLPVPDSNSNPAAATHSATGRWRYDELTRDLSLIFTASDFPPASKPQASEGYTFRLRLLARDAMTWLTEHGDGRLRLMQWLRTPAADSSVAGQWVNGAGFVLILQPGGALQLKYAGHNPGSYGFAGIGLLSQSPFQHGVASGDPQATTLVLWTRCRVDDEQDVPLRWRVAADPMLEREVASGEIIARGRHDHAVKVIVTGLEPGSRYYYVFETASRRDAAGRVFRSPIGRAKTLPAAGVAALTFAVVSCSSLPHGFFNAYRQVARREELDCVFHLGDYIYEYPGLDASADNDYADQAALDQGRMYGSDNQLEPTVLQHYRARHRDYKQDTDLQLLHSRHTVITTWDDHETADNSHDPDGSGAEGGAVNHQATEGAWETRKAFAVQAYDEWMPVAPIADFSDPQIHRSFIFGDLAELMILDTRIQGRHRQPDIFTDAYDDANRRLISEGQESWLKERLSVAQGKRTWKLIGQQVMMGHLQGPPLLSLEQPDSFSPELVLPGWLNVLNPDQWDGYSENRQRIWNHIDGNGIDNVVVLTGDIHSSWAMEMVESPLLYHLGSKRYGVEFVTPSVTSPGLPDPGGALTTAVRTNNPHIKYSNLDRHGYMVLSLNEDEAVARWYYVPDVLDRDNDQDDTGPGYRVVAGTRTLEDVS